MKYIDAYSNADFILIIVLILMIITLMIIL